MSFRPKCLLFALAVLSFLLAAPVAHAQYTFLPHDAVLKGRNRVPGTALVGYASFDDYLNGVNPTSPTIYLVDNGSVANDLQLFNSSVLIMRGGSIGAGYGNLLAYDNSTVNIRRGTVEIDVQMQHNSALNFNGGTIGNQIVTYDNSTANMRGGTVGWAIITNGSSTFNLSGGHIPDNVFIQDSSTLNIYGPNVTATLLDPNYQDFYSEYVLSGRLVDGTNVTGRIFFVQNDSGARFNIYHVRHHY